MFTIAVSVFCGLMFGWCVMPRPQWATNLWAKVLSYVPFLSSVSKA